MPRSKAKVRKIAEAKRKSKPKRAPEWRAVLRLPHETAARLKMAVDAVNDGRENYNKLSINMTIATIIEVWLEEEGF